MTPNKAKTAVTIGKHCRSCSHYRSISGYTLGIKVCNYLPDTGEIRGCPPDDCRELGKYCERGTGTHNDR